MAACRSPAWVGLLRDGHGNCCRGHEAQRPRVDRRRFARGLHLGWLVLPTAFLYRLVARFVEWWLETTQLGALTAVAGTTVLAAALATILGWRLVPLLLWIVALVLCVIVVPRALVRLPARAPQGLVFLLTVATQGVSLVASILAVDYHTGWLVYLAFVLWLLGIVFYLLIELHDFDHSRITTGPGDQWVFGGAVAITVMAGAKLITAAAGVRADDVAVRRARLAGDCHHCPSGRSDRG